MILKVATASLHYPSVPQSPSVISTSSTCLKRRGFFVGDRAHFPRYVDHFFRLYSSPSCDNPGLRGLVIRRAVSDSKGSFHDNDFSKQNQLKFKTNEGRDELPFPDRDEIIPANIERKANSVEIPFSLRMISRKLQWQEGFMEAGESAYCSVKKAFSSMVFIFQELHSYSLQMRGVSLYEDFMARVQKEMNASFVWLFQQVFSQTPSLMVYVMILLANYSVYSMASTAVRQPFHSYATEEVSVLEEQIPAKRKFNSSMSNTLNLYSSNRKTTYVGGNSGGGGIYKPVASGSDGDGRFDKSDFSGTIVPDGLSSVDYSPITNGEELVSTQENELNLWKLFVEKASKLQDSSINEVFDKERSISPAEFFKTDMRYQAALAHEPNNSLLLANYAQFLYLFAKDFDRAEEYFKKATQVEPKDAEALNKYATFLWMVRDDEEAAEATYNAAIDAEPEDAHYQGAYAHFLTITQGEETCFPLN